MKGNKSHVVAVCSYHLWGHTIVAELPACSCQAHQRTLYTHGQGSQIRLVPVLGFVIVLVCMYVCLLACLLVCWFAFVSCFLVVFIYVFLSFFLYCIRFALPASASPLLAGFEVYTVS